MALRFGDQGGGFATGLLFAAQTAILGTLITGTGNFTVALEVSQTGQGELPQVQVVTGTGSHGVSLTASQEGEGRLPQVVVNTGSTISWVGPSITVAQEGEGGSEVEPPQAVAGTGAFSIALDAEQSGSGDITIPPQHATGTGDHILALALSQDGEGESIVPAQVVQGGGTFTLTLAVGQSGEGDSEVPEDTTPDQFEFTAQAGVPLETTITSAPITVTGINAPTPISVSGGSYIVNGGEPTSDEGTVEVGDQVQAQHESSGAYLSDVTTTVTIGGVSGAFRSRTQGDPEQAAYIGRPFSFNWWRS